MSTLSIRLLSTGFVAACLAVAAAPASACTLWAAAGPQASGGGTLLAKNRDWRHGQRQALEYRFPRHGIPYFGLYAVDGQARGIKAGVNRDGLSAVTASASSIPNALRASQPGKQGVLRRILSHYASVDDLAAHASQVFSRSRAMFLLVSDRSKMLVAEIGLQGQYSYKVLDKGQTAHTNYYLDPALADFNIKVGRSSAARYARVTQLLGQSVGPYTLDAFSVISGDHHGGPDDSLWRTGKREATLASWIIDSPASGPQTLRVVIDNPGAAKTTRRFILDAVFWDRAGSDHHAVRPSGGTERPAIGPGARRGRPTPGES